MCISFLIKAQIPTNGLTGYWPFSASQLANDYSGNGNNGTVNGATLTFDRFGNCNQAYKFNGINNYITVPNSSFVDMNNTDFSVALWMKRDANNFNGIPLSKNQYGSWSGYQFFVNSTNSGYCNTPQHVSFYAASGNLQDACSNNAIDTVWHFITGVYVLSTNQSYIYIDGVLQISTGQTGGGLSTANDLVFGSNTVFSNCYMGLLDAIRIYKRALTNTEIVQLYNEPNPGSITNTGLVIDTTICSTGSVTLNAELASSYTWSVGNNTQSISTNHSGTYWVQLQPLNGCKQTDTFHLTLNVPQAINLLKDTTVCNNVAYVLSASQANATNYSWSTGSTNSSITPFNSGVYWVDMNINHCVIRDSAIINILSAPIISASNYTVCNGQQVTITPIISGGTGNYIYNWGGGFTGSSYNTAPFLDSTYFVSVTDANGCFTPLFTGSITVLPSLTVTVNGLSTCNSNTINLTANASGGTGNYTFTWMPSNTHQNPLSLIPQVNTIYTVTLSDGCTVKNAKDTAQVIIIPAPKITLPSNHISGCKPVCVNLTNISYDSLVTWQWNFGDGTNSFNQKPNYCYNKSGNYNISLTYTTNLGCIKTVISNSLVSVFSSPNAAFTASTFETDIFNTDINFYNESSNYTNSQWNFGDLSTSILKNPTHVYASTGNYPVMLIVQNNNGCVDTVIHEILVKDVFTFYAPNTFTPNEDNFNETFLPIGTGWDNESFKMSIYDRWGNLILNTTNYSLGWDGKIKGMIAQQDVYVWKVELRDVYKKGHSYSGIISIVR